MREEAQKILNLHFLLDLSEKQNINSKNEGTEERKEKINELF